MFEINFYAEMYITQQYGHSNHCKRTKRLKFLIYFIGCSYGGSYLKTETVDELPQV